MSSFRLSVLWSRKQIDPHAEWLRLPKDRFVFLPYKANHTKGPAYNLPIENYVFAGGNGKRDYQTLADAVRDTGIPVIVSATDPSVRKSDREAAEHYSFGGGGAGLRPTPGGGTFHGRSYG